MRVVLLILLLAGIAYAQTPQYFFRKLSGRRMELGSVLGSGNDTAPQVDMIVIMDAQLDDIIKWRQCAKKAAKAISLLEGAAEGLAELQMLAQYGDSNRTFVEDQFSGLNTTVPLFPCSLYIGSLWNQTLYMNYSDSRAVSTFQLSALTELSSQDMSSFMHCTWKWAYDPGVETEMACVERGLLGGRVNTISAEPLLNMQVQLGILANSINQTLIDQRNAMFDATFQAQFSDELTITREATDAMVGATDALLALALAYDERIRQLTTQIIDRELSDTIKAPPLFCFDPNPFALHELGFLGYRGPGRDWRTDFLPVAAIQSNLTQAAQAAVNLANGVRYVWDQNVNAGDRSSLTRAVRTVFATGLAPMYAVGYSKPAPYAGTGGTPPLTLGITINGGAFALAPSASTSIGKWMSSNSSMSWDHLAGNLTCSGAAGRNVSMTMRLQGSTFSVLSPESYSLILGVGSKQCTIYPRPGEWSCSTVLSCPTSSTSFPLTINLIYNPDNTKHGYAAVSWAQTSMDFRLI